MLKYLEDCEELKVSLSELVGNVGRSRFFCHTDCQTGKE